MQWNYQTIQFRTGPKIGIWSQLADKDIEKLDQYLNVGWEIHETVNIRGSGGFTAHVPFVLQRPTVSIAGR
jgi:hypothetical protein